MEKNIILAGVGGQGILSIAFVIDNAALDSGFHFKQAEVHGMAQRGGAVQSHLRYGDSEIYSDIVPTGRADLILSVEPLEVLRYWH
ncbi:MAG: 2-oxoacid:acceptor oxidoreductase family protein, partial [Acidobacteriota bacterium]|nr:2-oxoacid:acceptor oxidoreductase family protein [Acidobacteriota bacterium]